MAMDDDLEMATVSTRTATNSPAGNSSGPEFTNRNSLIKLVVKPSGNMIRLKCPAKGDPEPTIEWTKNGLPIDRKMGKVQYNKWAILLEDLVPDDSGYYTCKICNIHNCINFTTKLEVEGKIFLIQFRSKISSSIKLNHLIMFVQFRSLSISTNHNRRLSEKSNCLGKLHR